MRYSQLMKHQKAKYTHTYLFIFILGALTAFASVPGAPIKKSKPSKIGERRSIGGSIDKSDNKTIGGKKAPPRVVSAELVRDGRRRLLWNRCSYGQKAGVGGCRGSALRLSFLAANAHCKSRGKGKTRFRLPTLLELKSLLNKKGGGPKGVNAKLFPNTPPGIFWTATTFRGESRVRYVLDFQHATGYPFGTENNAFVRCVARK